MLIFEGRLISRTTSGSCLEVITPPVDGASLYDGTVFFTNFPPESVGFSLDVPAYALGAEALGLAKVYIETFRSDLTDPAFGTNTVSTRFNYEESDHRITSAYGPWQAFSFATGLGWSSGLQSLPPGSLEIEQGMEHVRWSANGSVFIDYTQPTAFDPAGSIRVVVYAALVKAGSTFTPMFSGAVRIYVEPYEPPADPDAFWTNFVGTKETV